MFPCSSTAAMRRFVPPRSTPIEKSAIDEALSLSSANFSCHSGLSAAFARAPRLFLAPRTVMTAAPSDNDALDRSFTDQARLAFAAIDPMLQLKEAFLSSRIDVIGDTGAAKANG